MRRLCDAAFRGVKWNCGNLLRRRWPFVLLFLAAVLHTLGAIRVDGYGIVLLVIAFLPALLPLVARYILSLKIGKEGIEATTRADDEGKIATEFEKRLSAANDAGSGEGRAVSFPYSIDARRVVATLWHYQEQLFGEDSTRRWGFGVGIGARDYGAFRDGVGELADAGLVHVDPRGLGYLTNAGMRFCREHRAILDADGPFYTQFAPAPSDG